MIHPLFPSELRSSRWTLVGFCALYQILLRLPSPSIERWRAAKLHEEIRTDPRQIRDLSALRTFRFFQSFLLITCLQLTLKHTARNHLEPLQDSSRRLKTKARQGSMEHGTVSISLGSSSYANHVRALSFCSIAYCWTFERKDFDKAYAHFMALSNWTMYVADYINHLRTVQPRHLKKKQVVGYGVSRCHSTFQSKTSSAYIRHRIHCAHALACTYSEILWIRIHKKRCDAAKYHVNTYLSQHHHLNLIYKKRKSCPAMMNCITMCTK